LEHGGDVRDVIDLAGGDADDEAVGVVVGQGDAQPVDVMEGE
jgi:hypothetical protein